MPLHYNPTRKQSTILSTQLLSTYWTHSTPSYISRSPYITPEIKTKLRRKNRLMHAGRVEEAGALAARIGKDIAEDSQQQLKHFDGRTDAKGLWDAVKKLTGCCHQARLSSLIIIMLAYRPIASIYHRHLSTPHYHVGNLAAGNIGVKSFRDP